MTSRLRLLMAGFAAIAALLIGWMNGVSTLDDAPAGRRSGLSAPQLAAAEDIDRYVSAIYESDLFPNAQLRRENGGEGQTGATQTIEELEQSLRDPSLSALVKREDVWRIFLYGDNEGSQQREVGDQLADGWIIQDITSTSVLLQKGEQTRLIETFKAEPDTQ